MRNTLAPLIAALLAASATPAQSAVLTFEGVGNNGRVDNFYNGGTDSAGNSGPNLGVSFTGGLIFSPNTFTGDTFQGAIDSDAPGGGYDFANEPSPNTTAILPGSIFAIMNVSGGFTSLSFYYSGFGGTATVYDGLNGSGNVLGSFSFGSNFANNCSGDPNGNQFCRFDPVTVPFSGTALSARFQGSLDYYDNLSLGLLAVPEPASWAMMLLGFGLVGAAMRWSPRHRARLAN
jgi:hypothetical protein